MEIYKKYLRRILKIPNVLLITLNLGYLSNIVHHPKFGIALKKQLDELGIECIVQYPGKTGEQVVRHGALLNEQPVNKVDFIRKHFEIAKRQDK
jgi:hypothetical protein